jgi:acetoin utilization deacetylase AcuC-like enzyme
VHQDQEVELQPLPIHYSNDYCHNGASFDTHVKARLVADRITAHRDVEVVTPSPATLDDLAAIHDPRYLDALESGEPSHLAESNGFGWSLGLLHGVLASTGGARDAALNALAGGGVSGSLSSGLHHASWSSGRGFCTVNGLALAAVAAVGAGAERVLILDLDAHCGGGTADIIRRHSGIEQVDISVIGFDRYDSDDIARLVMADGSNYLDVVDAELAHIEPASFDLIVYNAGMDPHERAGGVAGITTDVLADRERMVFGWAGPTPLAFVLAGGYAGNGFGLDDVASLHTRTVTAALGCNATTM